VWVAAALAVLVVAGVVVGLFLTSPQDSTSRADPTPATSRPTGTSTGSTDCALQVSIEVAGDDQAAQIVSMLREDRQASSVMLQSQQQTYEIFESEFQDQPSLAEIARPQALPAVVWVHPAPGVDPVHLADVYRARFTTAQEVQARSRCGPTVTSPTS
jgi:hypothetical protein